MKFLLLIMFFLFSMNANAEQQRTEKFNPQIIKRIATQITIEDEDGKKYPINVRKVGKSLIYQDDIVIGEAVLSASGIRKFLRWDNGIIPFYIAANHPLKPQILQAIETLNRETVLWYVPASNTGKDHISIINGSGCYSGIGIPIFGDSHDVSIGPGCGEQGTIIHELLHTAGLFHEQSRSDRDKYVSIYWNNIKKAERDNYEKAPWYGAKDIDFYNWNSVMHYSCNEFAIDSSKKTMEPTNARVAIGQRTGLSLGDVVAIRKMYSSISPNRGKPAMTPQPLPALIHPPFCTPTPIIVTPASQAQCNTWRTQISNLEENSDETLDINERKKMFKRIGEIEKLLQTRGCNQ